MMPQQLALFPDWSKRYRAVVARAEATSLGLATIPTREQLFATRRSVRAGWWTRATGETGGRADAAADAKLQAADEALLRAGFRLLAASLGVVVDVAPRAVGRGHGGGGRGAGWRAEDFGISNEERLLRKKARQQALRLERLAAGLCAACGKPKDREGKTCEACLQVDKRWRQSRSVREKTATYLDAECQPLVLTKPARMLPVIGERKDCLNENACLNELVDACGRQDPQGASCPAECPAFRPRDRRKQLDLFAEGRTGSASGW